METYDEEKLEHQEPVRAVSEWQQFNDADGSESIAHELDLESEQNVKGQPADTKPTTTNDHATT